MRIVLSGMPGCGKTTISALLAERLGCNAVDTDSLIVKKYGDITEIFSSQGEGFFREIETEAVEKACSLDSAVIATGGGCLLKSRNVELFKNWGKIVYLRTKISTLATRLEGDSTRPLLKGGTLERLNKLFNERAHVYENTADLIVDTDNFTPEEITEKITELLK